MPTLVIANLGAAFEARMAQAPGFARGGGLSPVGLSERAPLDVLLS